MVVDWLVVLAIFAAGIAVAASRAWWVALPPVILIDLVAVISWVSAALRPDPDPWEDPLPDFGPLLWAVLAMFVTLAACIGWTIRLYRHGRKRDGSLMLGLGVVPALGLWVAFAVL